MDLPHCFKGSMSTVDRPYHCQRVSGRSSLRLSCVAGPHIATMISLQVSNPTPPPSLVLNNLSRRHHDNIRDGCTWPLLLWACSMPELARAWRRHDGSRGRTSRLRVLQRLR